MNSSDISCSSSITHNLDNQRGEDEEDKPHWSYRYIMFYRDENHDKERYITKKRFRKIKEHIKKALNNLGIIHTIMYIRTYNDGSQVAFLDIYVTNEIYEETMDEIDNILYQMKVGNKKYYTYNQIHYPQCRGTTVMEKESTTGQKRVAANICAEIIRTHVMCD